MRSDLFDIVMLADWRRTGPVFWYQRNLAEAVLSAGYRLAIIQIDGEGSDARLGLRPWLRQRINDDQITWLDPATNAEAALAITIDAGLIAQPLNLPLRLKGDTNVVIQTQHTIGEDNVALIDRLETQLSGSIHLVAATDLIAAELPRSAGADDGIDPVWRPVVDLEMMRERAAARKIDGQPVVGTGVQTADEIDLRLFGWRHRALRLHGPKAVLTEGRETWPEAWRIDDSADVSISAFCRSIDAYLESYRPGSDGDSLCSGAILTAAMGGVAVASPNLASYLGKLATLSETPAMAIDTLFADRDALVSARETASEALEARHHRRCHQERIRDLIGEPRSSTVSAIAAPSTPKRRALFFSTNGVGMGHLTRQLAIARRLPRSIEPVFLSMSQACGQVEKFGFIAEFTPYHTYYQGQIEHWNIHLTHLLHEMIAFYDPSVVLFDGNHPFRALMNLREGHPGRAFIWSRRGLWRPEQNLMALERASSFDLIIEPLDLATVHDRGPTKAEQGRVRCIPPIRLLGDDELDDRETAAEALGLDPAKPAVLLQLGSRNNYDLAPLVDRLLPALRAVDDLQIATVRWLISEKDHGWPDDVHVLSGYPMAQFFAAFDFSIATPGYNTFHELVAHRVPAIFIPNENPSMDDHVTRAAFAERQGFGFSLRRAEVYKTAAVVDAISRPDTRARMRAAAARHAVSNGAGPAADAIEELVRSARGLRASFDLDIHRRAVV